MRDLLVQLDRRNDESPRVHVRGDGGIVSVAVNPCLLVVVIGRVVRSTNDERCDAAIALDHLCALDAGKRATIDSLDGEFSLIVFDKRSHQLFLLRDPTGSYPLFYASAIDGSWRAGVNAESVAGKGGSISFEYLAEYLATPGGFREVPSRNTAWCSVQRVLAGEEVTLEFGQPARSRLWWDWSGRVDSSACSVTPEEAATELRERLETAIRLRVKGRRAASFLSGGLDSSVVTALASRHCSSLSALSLVYSGNALEGETFYIRAMLSTLPHVTPVQIDGALAPDFAWFDNRPIPSHGEPHAGLFHLAAERALIEAAQEARAEVVLTGAGADEFLAGPPLDVYDSLRRGGILEALRLARVHARARLENPWCVLQRLGLQMLTPRWRSVPAWIHPDFARQNELHDRVRLADRAFWRLSLPEGELQARVARAGGDWSAWHLAAPVGLAVAQPFLDRHVLAWLLSLPSPMKSVPGVRKPVLANAALGLVPDNIRTRRHKVGFDDAYHASLNRHRRELEQLIRESDGAGIFDPEDLIAALRDYASGLGDASDGSWLNASLALLVWLRI